MKITKIIIKIAEPTENSKVKGYAKVTFDDCFIINSIRIIEGSQRYFVAMPSNKVNDDYIDVCHPITNEFRQYLDDSIINEYNRVLKETESEK